MNSKAKNFQNNSKYILIVKINISLEVIINISLELNVDGWENALPGLILHQICVERRQRILTSLTL